jgi:hypothetical protein
MQASSRLLALASLVACASATAAAPQPCCAFGGNGAATLIGNSVLAFPTDSSSAPSLYPLAMTVSGDDAAEQYVSFLVAPEDGNSMASLAGWLITGNATGQTIYVWRNVSGTPECSSASAASPEYYVPSFSLCAGSGLFSRFEQTYKVGSAGVFNMFGQVGSSGAVAAFASFSSGDCAPVFVQGFQSPWGTGAFQFTVLEGGAGANANWGQPPSFC